MMYKLVNEYARRGIATPLEFDTETTIVDKSGPRENRMTFQSSGSEKKKLPFEISINRKPIKLPEGTTNPMNTKSNSTLQNYQPLRTTDLFSTKYSVPSVFTIKEETKSQKPKPNLPPVSSMESIKQTRLISSKMAGDEKEKLISSYKRGFKGKDISHLETDRGSQRLDSKLALRTSFGFFTPTANSKAQDKLHQSKNNDLSQERRNLGLPLIQNLANIHKQFKKPINNEFLAISLDMKNDPVDELLDSLGKQEDPTHSKTHDRNADVKVIKDTYFEISKSFSLLRLKDTSLLLSLYKMLPNCLQNMPSNKKETDVLRQWFIDQKATSNQAAKLELGKLAMLEGIRQVYVGFADRGVLLLELLQFLLESHQGHTASLRDNLIVLQNSFNDRIEQTKKIFEGTLQKSIDRLTELELQNKKLQSDLYEANQKIEYLESVEAK